MPLNGLSGILISLCLCVCCYMNTERDCVKESVQQCQVSSSGACIFSNYIVPKLFLEVDQVDCVNTLIHWYVCANYYKIRVQIPV